MSKDGKSFSGKGVFPSKYAFTLLIPLRNVFLSPRKLIRRLALQKEHRVLEIGPGPGYFSTHIAKVLTGGRLVLADIQQAMLDKARRRMEKRKLTNVDYSLCDGERLDFEDGCFDRVFMVTVLGEVENQQGYLREIRRILKADGILSVSELGGDPDKLSQEDLQALVCPEGFTMQAVFGSKRNYTANFVKSS